MGVIRYIYWNGSAHYNGLNVNLDKKFSHGLQFQVAYTFSKSHGRHLPNHSRRYLRKRN